METQRKRRALRNLWILLVTGLISAALWPAIRGRMEEKSENVSEEKKEARTQGSAQSAAAPKGPAEALRLWLLAQNKYWYGPGAGSLDVSSKALVSSGLLPAWFARAHSDASILGGYVVAPLGHDEGGDDLKDGTRVAICAHTLKPDDGASMVYLALLESASDDESGSLWQAPESEVGEPITHWPKPEEFGAIWKRVP